MSRIILLFIGTLLFYPVFSQLTTKYTTGFTNDVSLTDMSTGTTLIFGPDVDGLNNGQLSPVINVGFPFVFMGVPYSEFTITEDACLRFGNSVSGINRVANLDVSEPRLVAFACDMRVGSNGKVHYKVIGSEPNRILVIEWKNLVLRYSDNSEEGQSLIQIRLYESNGRIEYVYGNLFVSNYSGTSDWGAIGFGIANTNNKMIYKKNSLNSNTWGTLSNQLSSNLILQTSVSGTGYIGDLASSQTGLQSMYFFIPPAAAAAPSDLTFSNITQTQIRLNWNDNSNNENGFYIYKSLDGTNYTLFGQTSANAESYTINNLAAGINYYFKICAFNEGSVSSFLYGNQSTLPAGNRIASVSGNWNSTTTWGGLSIPTSTDNVIINDGVTVIINTTNCVCNNMTVGQGNSGILRFIGGTTSATLSVYGDCEISNGAVFDITPDATGGSRKLIIGNQLNANGNLIVNGTVNFNLGSSSVADVEFKGSENAAISGVGNLCNFYSITLSKGSNINSVLEVLRSINLDIPSSTGSRLVLTKGTFKISYALNLEPYFGTQTICSSTAQLWLNHPACIVQSNKAGTLTGAGDPTITGVLRISEGLFKYGSGNNNMNITGKLILDGNSSSLVMFGKITFTNTSYTNISKGSIIIDPQSANNLPAGNVCDFVSNCYLQGSGGTIIITDPNANSSSYEISIASEQNKSYENLTFQLGDGQSLTQGNSNGFRVRVPAYVASFKQGNLLINNPSGTNRHVMLQKSSGSDSLNFNSIRIIAGNLRLNSYNNIIRGSIFNDGVIEGGGSVVLKNGYQNHELNGNGIFDNVIIADVNHETYLTSDIIISKDFSINSGCSFNHNNHILLCQKNVMNNGICSGNGKILLTQGEAQHLISGQGIFEDIELSDSQGALTVSNIQMNGDLIISEGTFEIGSFNFIMSPTSVINNNSSLLISGNNGVKEFGTLSINSAAQFINNIANEDITLRGSLINNGIFLAGNGQYTLNGLPATVSGNSALSGMSVIIDGEIIYDNSAISSFNNLTINNSKSLMIKAKKALTVTGNLINNGGVNSLFIDAEPNGFSGSLITNGTVTGSGTSAFKTSIIKNRWHAISSPVYGTDIAQLFSDISQHNNNFFRYDETSLDDYWVQQTTGLMNVAQGYYLYYFNNKFKIYSGVFNSGNISIPLTYTPDGRAGWNFVGNPYPSAIDWDAQGWTKNNINNAVYVKNNDVWESYIAGVGECRYIYPGQGFFVVANENSSLGMSNEIRVHRPNDFLKDENTDPVLKISISNDSSETNTYLHFINSASMMFDPNLDAYKIFSENEMLPELYTLTSNFDSLSINSLPYNIENFSIPLGVKTGIDGNYKISLKSFSNNNEFNSLFLKDNENGTITNLLIDSSYSFNNGLYNSASRFELFFNTNIVNIPSLNQAVDGFMVSEPFVIGNKLCLNVVSNEPALEAALYDVSGKCILVEKFCLFQKNQTIFLQLNNISKGYYFLKLRNGSQLIVKKVFY